MRNSILHAIGLEQQLESYDNLIGSFNQIGQVKISSSYDWMKKFCR